MSAWRGLQTVVAPALAMVLCCLVTSGRGLADAGDVTAMGSVGGAYLPMGDWKEFSGGRGHYHTDALGRTREIALGYELSDRVGFTLSGGLVTTSATNTDYFYFLDEWGRPVDSTAYYSAWDFKGYPVGLSMELYPWTSKGPVATCVGLGFSYYFSEVRARLYLMPDRGLPGNGPVKPRRGAGYGFHGYLSVRAQVGGGFAVVARLRAQYADGMANTEQEGSVPVRFSGVDLSIGLAWTACACRGSVSQRHG